MEARRGLVTATEREGIAEDMLRTGVEARRLISVCWQGPEIKGCTMGLAWEQMGQVTEGCYCNMRCLAETRMGRLREGWMKIQWCCTKRGATELACAKIRAPRRRSEANEGMEDRGDCQQVGWKGSSGDYPGKDSIRVGASEGATR